MKALIPLLPYFLPSFTTSLIPSYYPLSILPLHFFTPFLPSLTLLYSYYSLTLVVCCSSRLLCCASVSSVMLCVRLVRLVYITPLASVTPSCLSNSLNSIFITSSYNSLTLSTCSTCLTCL